MNGDGRLDLVIQRSSHLSVFVAEEDGLPTRPTRSEPLPDYLDKEEHDLVLRLHDLDADDRPCPGRRHHEGLVLRLKMVGGHAAPDARAGRGTGSANMVQPYAYRRSHLGRGPHD